MGNVSQCVCEKESNSKDIFNIEIKNNNKMIYNDISYIKKNQSTVLTSNISLYEQTLSPCESISQGYNHFDVNNSSIFLDNIKNRNNNSELLLQNLQYYQDDNQKDIYNIIESNKYFKILSQGDTYKILKYIDNQEFIINQHKNGISLVLIVILTNQKILFKELLLRNCNLFIEDQYKNQNAFYILLDKQIFNMEMIGSIKDVEEIINFDIFINYKNNSKKGYLFPISRYEQYLSLLEYLINKFNNFNKNRFIDELFYQNDEGFNVIHSIVQFDSIKILKYLIETFNIEERIIQDNYTKGSEIFDFQTLCIYCKSDYKQLINFDYCMPLTKLNFIHLLVEQFDKNIFDTQIINFFNEKNSLKQINKKTQSGKNFIFFSANTGNIYVLRQIFKILTKNDQEDIYLMAYLEDKDLRGFTPLHSSVYNSKQEFTELLLEQGVDSNVKAQDNITPLHLAVLNKDINLVKLLLINNADPLLKNSYGESSMKLAFNYQLFEIIELLCKS